MWKTYHVDVVSFVHKILQLVSSYGSRGHLTARGRVLQICVPESDLNRSWKYVSFIHPESVMVTDEPYGKPSANSKRCAFPLNIAIGGMTFPTGFYASQDISKFPFFTEVLEYTAVLLLSANTSLVGLCLS